MRVLFIASCFFCWSFGPAVIGYCAGSVPQEDGASANKETLPDFFSLRDPFLSVLPKPVIVKTPVELPMQNVDNDKKEREAGQGALANPIPIASEPVQVSHSKPPELHIKGIIWGSEHPQAIINNAVVGVGDEVSGVKIDSIQKDEVVVSFEGDKVHVHVEE